MEGNIIFETTVPFPINLSLKKYNEKRYELVVNEKVFNFFEKEQLYFHVDQGTLGLIVTKVQQEKGIFKKLRDLVLSKWPLYDGSY